MPEITITVPEEFRGGMADWSIRDAKRRILRDALHDAADKVKAISEEAWEDSSTFERLEPAVEHVRSITEAIRELEVEEFGKGWIAEEG
jgi:hypothetical protein